jgi:hypothetical protein
MDILPGIGVGDLRFGMTKAQVFERLGFPNKSYLSSSNDREVQYFERRLVLKFETGNGDRLGWIEVHGYDSVMFGESPWGLPQPQVVELISRSLKEEPEHEDFGSFESLTWHDHWVEAQFQFGRLSCINLGVRYDDDDSPLWPPQA